jgi:hypothetical protein
LIGETSLGYDYNNTHNYHFGLLERTQVIFR